MIADGDTVMIDIGTTTLQAARHLHGRPITVITTSLAVYEELLPDAAIELILPGGIVRRNYRSLVGLIAEDSLRQLRADVLLLGTSSVDAELGVWDSTMVEVPIKRAMIGASERVLLLADAVKFALPGTRPHLRGGRDRRHRHRRPAPGPRATRRSPRRTSRSPSHEAHDRRRRRLPRARWSTAPCSARTPGGLSSTRSCSTTSTPAARPHRPRARRPRGRARRAAAVPHHHRPGRRGRGRRLRFLRDPGRPARRAASSTRASRSRSACSARRPPGRAGSASRCGRSRRWCGSPR